MNDKQRIETLQTALEHALGILQHKKLSPQELADYRKLKSYIKWEKENGESEAQS